MLASVAKDVGEQKLSTYKQEGRKMAIAYLESNIAVLLYVVNCKDGGDPLSLPSQCDFAVPLITRGSSFSPLPSRLAFHSVASANGMRQKRL